MNSSSHSSQAQQQQLQQNFKERGGRVDTSRRLQPRKRKRTPLLPLEDRVPAEFNQALAGTPEFLKDVEHQASRAQLFCILCRLQRTAVVVDGHYSTVRLIQLAQASFPGSTTTLCQPKYNQRTMETLL